jgi:hypothetical protein
MICGASCGKYQLRYPLVDFAAPPIGRTPDASGGISGEFPANGNQRKAGMAGCGGSPLRTVLHGFPSQQGKIQGKLTKMLLSDCSCSQKHSIYRHFDVFA